MPANPPISNNSNDDNDEITVPLHPTPQFIEPAVAMVATADEALGVIHSSPTPDEKKPALETNRNIADPITPTGIILTPRQQRVLRYLARRRMRNARIIKRQHTITLQSKHLYRHLLVQRPFLSLLMLQARPSNLL